MFCNVCRAHNLNKKTLDVLSFLGTGLGPGLPLSFQSNLCLQVCLHQGLQGKHLQMLPYADKANSGRSSGSILNVVKICFTTMHGVLQRRQNRPEKFQNSTQLTHCDTDICALILFQLCFFPHDTVKITLETYSKLQRTAQGPPEYPLPRVTRCFCLPFPLSLCTHICIFLPCII